MPPMLILALEMYSTLCMIEADTSQISEVLRPRRAGITSNGQPRTRRQEYHSMEFDIVLSFGLTELKAQICWMEDVRSIHHLFSISK